MRPDLQNSERKWHAKHRWALSAAILGALIVAAVIVTGGEHGTWALWIAIPLLMFSLGYLFLVNAIPIFVDSFSSDDSEKEDE